MNRRLFLCDSLLPWGSGRIAKCCADSTGVGSGQTDCLSSVPALPQPFPPPMAMPSATAAAYLGPGTSLGALWHRLGSGLVGVCLTPGQRPSFRPRAVCSAAWCLPCPRPCVITPSDFTSRAQVKGDTVKNQGSTRRTSPRAWALLRAAPQGGVAGGRRLCADGLDSPLPDTQDGRAAGAQLRSLCSRRPFDYRGRRPSLPCGRCVGGD